MSFWAFLRAVKGHWVTLMSGGSITVAIGMYQYFSQRSVPVSLYVAVLMVFVVTACYLAWRDSKRREAELTDRVSKLEEKARPKLRILYNDGEFNHDEYLNGEIIGRVIRFAIENDSDAVVNGVKAEAIGFINVTGTRLPAMGLQVTGDTGNLKGNGFSLNPRAIQPIDLMKKHYDSQEMYLATSVQGVNVGTQQDRMTLEILVSGETSQIRKTTFRVWTNNNGLLECN